MARWRSLLAASPIANGPVTLDGSAGSPAVTVNVTSPGQFWTNNGALAFVNNSVGTPAANFNFGSLSPSTTVAPVQISGNVAFTVTPNVTVSGAAIAAGTYPLIKYAGSASGTMPAVTITLAGGSASGFITNLVASKTIALVVTSSSFNPALFWAVGNGVWDVNTANWKQFSVLTNYTDGDAVVFDDSAAGPSPMTVTLNTMVNPLNLTFNNAAPTNYTITGSGGISGSASLNLLNSGTVTLSGTNSYSGGTTISGGRLNINTGGTPSGSAIGTGPLTINSGAIIDNTSTARTLRCSPRFPKTGTAISPISDPPTASIPAAAWLAMTGNVTLNVGPAATLPFAGGIGDGGNNYLLSKTGNGTLTLPTANSFSGGLTLSSGLLNLGDPNSEGFGVFHHSGRRD